MQLSGLSGQSPPSNSGKGGGGFWLGVFLSILCFVFYWAFGRYREGGLPAVKDAVVRLVPGALQKYVPPRFHSTGASSSSRGVAGGRAPLAAADFNAGAYNAPTVSPMANAMAAPMVAPVN